MKLILNEAHINRPLQEILSTLLHGMAHEWQELFGKPGKGTFHNRQFTDKCRGLGIPCAGGRRSYTLAYEDPFVRLLRQHGVDAETRIIAAAPLQAPQKQSIRMKLWECVRPVKVRCAVDLAAVCQHCGKCFERKEAD